jgi:hypothetical protein
MKSRHSRALARCFAAILSLFAAGGCAVRANDAGSSEPPRGPEFTRNAVVVAWNQIAYDAAVTHDGFQDFAVNVRGITSMHLAVHDALNSIVPSYDRYAFSGAVEPLAHPTAAVAQAARDVLVDAYPAQQAAIDAKLTTFLETVPEGEGKELGVQLGKSTAQAIVAGRSGDGWDATGTYAPRANPRPGDYRFVPPFDFVFRPAFGDAKPFGIDNAVHFRGPPPPELSSAVYAKAYDEVKALGARSGSPRSEDQSHEARWWYEFAEIGWNRIANLLVRQKDVELYPAARLFALVNMGLADAYVAIWNSKRFYDRWRPYTAIRAGDPDLSWEPYCVTPPTWEYPSAHAMQSAAAAEMLVWALGTDSVSFTATSTTAPPERPVRSFTSLRGAAIEAADSRVLCGIHFRFATDVGLEQGRNLAESILKRHLRPSRQAGVAQ